MPGCDMSQARTGFPVSRRGGLLGIVLGAHAAVGLLLVAARSVAPQLLDNPLVVDLLPPPEPPRLEAAKPLPTAPSQPKHQPPRAPQPPAVATNTNAVAPSSPSVAPSATTSETAPVVAPAASHPVAPTPAHEPVTPAKFDAAYLRNPAPAYPSAARRMNEEGKVVLSVRVSPQGTAEQVEVKTSSGSVRLDEAAINTVRNWKFVPAKRGDTPIESWALVPIAFKLEQ